MKAVKLIVPLPAVPSSSWGGRCALKGRGSTPGAFSDTLFLKISYTKSASKKNKMALTFLFLSVQAPSI